MGNEDCVDLTTKWWAENLQQNKQWKILNQTLKQNWQNNSEMLKTKSQKWEDKSPLRIQEANKQNCKRNDLGVVLKNGVTNNSSWEESALKQIH